MDRATFLNYLKQPALLSGISLEELLRLTGRYPYATNLLLLVVLKAKQTGDKDYEYYLSRFAAATCDRPHFFDLLQSIELRREENGEVLELMELEELELAPLQDPFEELPSRLNELPGPAQPVTVTTAPNVAPVASPAEEPVYAAPTGESLVTAGPVAKQNEWVAFAAAYSELIESTPTRPAAPDDPASFAHLVARRQPAYDLTERLLDLRRGAHSVRRPKAASSPAVVSETLADLLVRQGQYTHAIRMYRRLMLLYPEKKSIFAGLIQELKEKS